MTPPRFRFGPGTGTTRGNKRWTTPSRSTRSGTGQVGERARSAFSPSSLDQRIQVELHPAEVIDALRLLHPGGGEVVSAARFIDWICPSSRAGRRRRAVLRDVASSVSLARTTSLMLDRLNSARSSAIWLNASASSPARHQKRHRCARRNSPAGWHWRPRVSRRTGMTTARVRCQATATAIPRAARVISSTARRAASARSRPPATACRASSK